ncbi:MAG: hypothetical protein Q9195_005661 [Heterodermia aff. obscurata]
MVYPNCYLQLSQGANENEFRTTLFGIQAETGGTTTWGVAATSNTGPSATSNAVPSLANSPSEAVSPSSLNEASSIHTITAVTGISSSTSSFPSSTQAAANGNVATQRPDVALDSDQSDEDYVSNQVNCTDNGNPYEPGCWEVLQINRWLPQWFIETKVCPSDQPNKSQVDCNKKPQIGAPEPWSTTFLREYSRGGDAECLTIGPGACSYDFDQNVGSADNPLLRARYKYVRYNIIAISTFFNTWYEAIENGLQQASEQIDSIIALVDPVKKTHTKLNAILTALSLAFTLIPLVGPETALALELGATGIKAANLMIKGIKNAPSLAQQVWPQGTENSQDLQIDQLKGVLDRTLKPDVLLNIQAALQVVQGVDQANVSDFLAFVGQGILSTTSNIPSLLTTSTISALAMTTYLVTTALASNGWHILMVPGADPTKGSSQCPTWTGGCEEKTDMDASKCLQLDQYQQCSKSYWWYSVAHKSSYTLDKGDGTDATEIIQKIFNSSWSNGALLFEGAAVCEMQNMLQSVSSVNYTTTTDGVAGFTYEEPFTDLAQSDETHYNSTVPFIRIDGGAFPHLSMMKKYSDLQFHPQSTIYNIDANGLDFRCISQLNTSIANSWSGNWTANQAES